MSLRRVTYPCVIAYKQPGYSLNSFAEVDTEAQANEFMEKLYKLGCDMSLIKILVNSGFKINFKISIEAEPQEVL
jgi:hypothetical protein